ncbi:MAG: hypothetical protein ACOYNL_09950 [Rickettsiales bacterium]
MNQAAPHTEIRQPICRTTVKCDENGKHHVKIEFRPQADTEYGFALAMLGKSADAAVAPNGNLVVKYGLSPETALTAHVQSLAKLGVPEGTLRILEPYMERALNPLAKDVAHLKITDRLAVADIAGAQNIPSTPPKPMPNSITYIS